MNESAIYATKFVSSIALGGVAYVASTLATLLDTAPTWLEKYGFPTMACGLLCVGGFYLIKMLISLQNARLQDLKEHAGRLEKFVEEGASSRAKLIQINEELLVVTKEQLAAQAKAAIASEKAATKLHALADVIHHCGKNGHETGH